MAPMAPIDEKALVRSKGPLQSIQLARICKLEGDWTARVETSSMWLLVRKTDSNTLGRQAILPRIDLSGTKTLWCKLVTRGQRLLLDSNFNYLDTQCQICCTPLWSRFSQEISLLEK